MENRFHVTGHGETVCVDDDAEWQAYTQNRPTLALHLLSDVLMFFFSFFLLLFVQFQLAVCVLYIYICVCVLRAVYAIGTECIDQASVESVREAHTPRSFGRRSPQ